MVRVPSSLALAYSFRAAVASSFLKRPKLPVCELLPMGWRIAPSMMFWYMSYGVAPLLVQCRVASKLPLATSTPHASAVWVLTLASMPSCLMLSLMIASPVM
ncbi:hypothetical protein SMICM304S_06561 [Streptomyces microflavus]